MFFICFDCSSRTIHIVVLDEQSNIVVMKKFSSNTKDVDIRCCDLSAQLRNYIIEQADIFLNSKCTIENPIVVQNVKASFLIANVINAVKIRLYDAGIDFWGLDNKVWKRGCLGNGGASKDEILRFAEIKWGKGIFSEQDFADSALIGFYGWLRFNNKG